MAATSDVWEVLSTARTIRRFTDEPVDDETLRRCLEAATWAPNGANGQAWRFIVLRAPEQRAAVAEAARRAVADPGVQQKLRQNSAEVWPDASPAAAAALVRSETERWGGIVRRIGLTAQ